MQLLNTTHKSITQHSILTWFTSRMEVTSTELCFYYSSGEGKHSSAAPHMQLEIFWVTPHIAWSPSLLDLFSTLYCTSYNILFPLYRSLQIVTCMLYEPATSYSKITTANNRTRAWLLYNCPTIV